MVYKETSAFTWEGKWVALYMYMYMYLASDLFWSVLYNYRCTCTYICVYAHVLVWAHSWDWVPSWSSFSFHFQQPPSEGVSEDEGRPPSLCGDNEVLDDAFFMVTQQPWENQVLWDVPYTPSPPITCVGQLWSLFGQLWSPFVHFLVNFGLPLPILISCGLPLLILVSYGICICFTCW